MTESGAAQAGLAVVELLREGQLGQIHDRFAPQVQSLVTVEALRAGWQAVLARAGKITDVGVPVTEQGTSGTVTVKIPVTCERATLTVIVPLDSDELLHGLQFAPAEAALPVEPWQLPAYIDPLAFGEQDVIVGSGSLAVPGTLSVPGRSGTLPAVVLLAGSGPSDRDETLGRNKPFKDLAWGLATLGIVVLRFDKVTFAHRTQVLAMPDFNLEDEYLHHTLAAVALLRAHQSVDAAKVFVLGHSLGGTVAPRVAKAEAAVAGLVIMAGGAQPMHWAAVRQMRYIAALNPQTAAASESTIDIMAKQAHRVDSPDLSPSTPAGELPFGVPAPYWLDVRGYDQVATAHALSIPILIVQGGRDYQATVTDDLARWQAGLAGRANVTTRVYDADNHFFFAGSGPSTPAEYEPAQHMDPADIATWLTSL